MCAKVFRVKYTDPCNLFWNVIYLKKKKGLTDIGQSK